MSGNQENDLEIQVWKNESERNYINSYSSRIVGENLGAYYVEGGSASVQNHIAKNKAVFEAIERYSGSKIPKNLRKDSYKNIKDFAVDPSNFIFFADDQYKRKMFPYIKYSYSDQIEWTNGYSLISSKKLLIPAFATYLGYNQRIPSSQKYFPTASCGLAIQKNDELAIINGVLELIERDAAMKVWLNKLSAPIVDLSTIRYKKLKKLLIDISHDDLTIKVILSSQNLSVPSFIGMIYSNKKSLPYMTIGLSAGVDIEKSIQKSLEEALMVRNSLDYMKKKYCKSVFNKSQLQVKSFFDHTLYYSSPKRIPCWKFMTSGNVITINKIKKMFPLKKLQQNTLDTLVNIFRELDYEMYVVDLTSNIARQMDLCCFKVIIPNLRQMEIDNNFKFFKYGSEIDREKLKKSEPHPFA